MSGEPAPLGTRYLMTLEVTVATPVQIGDVATGARRCVPLTGGRFHGTIAGQVVPGGADWQTTLQDGSLEIEARYALRTNEDEMIEISSIGVRHGPPAAIQRLQRGETVDPSEYYFRTHMRFTTAAPRLLRLNHVLAVTRGQRLPEQVNLHVFEVL